MAFTDTQKAKIRLYLGYPDVFRAGSPRLESAMDTIGGRPEVQTEVEGFLASVAAAVAKLDPAALNSVMARAGVKKVDEIEFFGTQSGGTPAIADVSKLGRLAVGMLSITLGVGIENDIFGGQGYSGDEWSRADTQYFGGNGRGGGPGGMFGVG